MEQSNNSGVLFGSISYTEKQHISDLIDNMEFEQSFFYIVQALKYSHQSGVFSLEESEIVSKSLRVFTSKLSEKK